MRRRLAQLVNTPVDVRIFRFVIARNRIYHAAGFLRRRTVVQIDQRVAVRR